MSSRASKPWFTTTKTSRPSSTIQRKRLFTPISSLLAANNVVGFNTYGEQHNAMHVNQTLTGVAIGWPAGFGH